MHEIDRLYAFFKKRNGHADNKLCLVNAQQIGGGKQNYCLTTAEDNSQSMGYGLISGLTCLVFSSQHHLETLAPLVDSFPHSDMNSSGVL